MTKQKNKRKILIIASVVLITALAIGLTVGLSSAKYKTEKNMAGNVKFSATLAQSIELLEHKATRGVDGSYELSDTVTATSQTYELMPGVDVPKDPYIVVTGKTSIPAYLYVEIIESTSFPATVTYALTADWTLVKGENDTPLAGPNGGKLYVYKAQLTDTNTTTGSGDNVAPVQFYILKDNMLIVSDQLPRGTTATLDFYAYICQVVDGDPAKDFRITPEGN
jgi:hypothetical protein